METAVFKKLIQQKYAEMFCCEPHQNIVE